MLQEFVAGAEDGWDRFRGLLGPWLAAADGAPSEEGAPALADATRLGRRTAELHLALASDRRTREFAPVPMTRSWLAALAESSARHARTVLDLLAARLPSLGKPDLAAAQEVLAGGDATIERFLAVARLDTRATRIRCHGDYHLGQTLYSRGDFLLLDFEGEPLRSLDERREKSSPLKDVAGMLRSFDYVAHATLREAVTGAPQLADAAFLREYLTVARGASFLPEREADLHVLLDAFVLDKLFYELAYELANRPDWLAIPLEALRVAGGPPPERPADG
jgi:maltose alpha-D-glucosyltransferase/alpha-amylase